MLKVKTITSSYTDSLDAEVNKFLEQSLIIRSVTVTSYGYGTASYRVVTQILYEEGSEGSKFKSVPSDSYRYAEDDNLDIQRQE